MIKAIDLFAGIGGLSYPFFHSNNYEIVAAIEILKDMCETYEINHPGVKIYNDDIKNISYSKILEDLGEKAEGIDLIIGGPPCQAYSTLGKRLMTDDRGKLFQEYYRLLSEIKPKAFVFENVKGLLSMGGGQLIKEIVELFEGLGYNVKYQLLNVADYGVPQLRERVVIVGNKVGVDFKFPIPTHFEYPVKGQKKYISLGEAISDLPEVIKNGDKDYKSSPQNEYQKYLRKKSTKITDHNKPKNGENLMKLMEVLKEGQCAIELSEEYADIKPKSGFNNTYGRLWWDKPSTTITRNLSTPSSSRCIHPKENRPLSTREGARIQSFPDDFIFKGSSTTKNLQIGNAVPPLLSKVIMNELDKQIFKNTESN